jgi:hypothetical protein
MLDIKKKICVLTVTPATPEIVVPGSWIQFRYFIFEISGIFIDFINIYVHIFMDGSFWIKFYSSDVNKCRTSCSHICRSVIFIFFILDMNKCRVGQSSCSYIWSFSYFSFQVWMSVVSQSSCSHICRSIIGCLIFSILEHFYKCVNKMFYTCSHLKNKI